MERSTSGVFDDIEKYVSEEVTANYAPATMRIVVPFQGSFRDGTMVRRNGGWEVVKTVTVPKESHHLKKNPQHT